MSPCPIPATISITPQAPPSITNIIIINSSSSSSSIYHYHSDISENLVKSDEKNWQDNNKNRVVSTNHTLGWKLRRVKSYGILLYRIAMLSIHCRIDLIIVKKVLLYKKTFFS